jgi:hypothetical protein
MIEIRRTYTPSSSSNAIIATAGMIAAWQLVSVEPITAPLPHTKGAKLEYPDASETKRVYGNLFGDLALEPWWLTPQLDAPSSNLLSQIQAARLKAKVDPEFVRTADAAVADAANLLQANSFSHPPKLSISDEGILALQWQQDQQGVLLMLAGDGEASIAFWKPGQLYAENGVESPVTEKLPAIFYETLAAVFKS